MRNAPTVGQPVRLTAALITGLDIYGGGIVDIAVLGEIITCLGLAVGVTSVTFTYVVPKVNGGSTPHVVKLLQPVADFSGLILTFAGLSLLGWWHGLVLAPFAIVLFFVILCILIGLSYPLVSTPRGKRRTEASTDPKNETEA